LKFDTGSVNRPLISTGHIGSVIRGGYGGKVEGGTGRAKRKEKVRNGEECPG